MTSRFNRNELRTDPELLALIERARTHVMTPEEIEAQRISWVIGQIGLMEGETRDSAEARVREALRLPASGHVQTAAEAPGITLRALARACADRQIEWTGGGEPFSALFHGVELAGETGEALNVLKKLERERLGAFGSRASLEDLGDELADVVMCAVNLANRCGIDLEAHTVAKFNAGSEKHGFKTRITLAEEG